MEATAPPQAISASAAPQETSAAPQLASVAPQGTSVAPSAPQAALAAPCESQRKGTRNLTRDQRIEVRALRKAGLNYLDISKILHVTFRQVQIACTADSPTPKARSGRPVTITHEQIQEIAKFLDSSKEAQRMSWLQLSRHFQKWSLHHEVIQRAMEKEGFKRVRSKRSDDPGAPKYRVAGPNDDCLFVKVDGRHKITVRVDASGRRIQQVNEAPAQTKHP